MKELGRLHVAEQTVQNPNYIVVHGRAEALT
jgi:hypothetical protein